MRGRYVLSMMVRALGSIIDLLCHFTWWHYDGGTRSISLALCDGIPSVDALHIGPVIWSCCIFSVVSVNMLLKKRTNCRWFVTQSFSCVATLMIAYADTERIIPDNKVHGTNMGPTWVLSAPAGPHVGPMNLAIRDVRSPILYPSCIQIWMWGCVRRRNSVPHCNVIQTIGLLMVYAQLTRCSRSVTLKKWEDKQSAAGTLSKSYTGLIWIRW